MRSERFFYYLIWAIALAACGRRTICSIRGPVARCARFKGGLEMAEAFGVDAGRLKIVVFVYAAVLACVSGWLYAHLQRSSIRRRSASTRVSNICSWLSWAARAACGERWSAPR